MLKVAIFNDTRQSDKHFGCEIVMTNLLQLLSDHALRPVWLGPANQDWRNNKNRLPELGSIDAVIVNGEGTIHHSKCRAHRLADIPEICEEHLQAPAFLINATLHKNDPSIYNKLKKFRHIFVRDSSSLYELLRHGITGSLVADLTLASTPSYDTTIRSGIGVSDSVIQSIRDALRSKAKAENWSYQPIATSKQKKISYADIFNPLSLSKKMRLKEALKEEAARFEKMSSRKYLSWLASKNLIISGRYHAVTLCLLTKTPFIAIESNTNKISALVNDAGINPLRVIQNIDAINNYLIESLHSYSEIEQQNIDIFIANARRENREMCQLIHESISGNQGNSAPHHAA